MRKLILLPVMFIIAGCTSLYLTGCKPSFVTGAVDTLAASNGAIVQAQADHLTECQATPSKPICATISTAVTYENMGLDALESYCSLPVRPDAATLAAQGTTTCKENPTAKAALVNALSNVSAILADYQTLNATEKLQKTGGAQ